MRRTALLVATMLVFTSCICSREALKADLPTASSSSSTERVLDFRLFIWRFFQEPEFQISHVQFPLQKLSKEINQNYEIVRETIKRQDWRHLPGPEHFRCKTSCYDTVIYDNFDRQFRGKTERVLAFEGVDNGINNALYFKLENGEWMLVKWEDLSD